MNPDLRRKALAHLRAGRVTVAQASGPYDGAADRVTAVVESSQGPGRAHIVDLIADGWIPDRGMQITCTSGAGRCEQPCAHVAAVALVTGWPTEARP